MLTISDALDSSCSRLALIVSPEALRNHMRHSSLEFYLLIDHDDTVLAGTSAIYI